MQPISFVMTGLAVMDIAGHVSKITDKFSLSPSRVYLPTTEKIPTEKRTRRKTASVYTSSDEAAAPRRPSQPTVRPSFPISVEDAPIIDLDSEVPLLHAEHNRMTLKARGFVPLATITEVSESKPSFELVVTPATPIDESNPYFSENDGNVYIVDEEGNYWAAVDMNHLSLQWTTSTLDERLRLAEEEGEIIQWPTFWGEDNESTKENEEDSDEAELVSILNDLLMSERMERMFDDY